MSRPLLQAILVNLQEHTIGQIHDDMDEFEVVAILKGFNFYYSRIKWVCYFVLLISLKL